MEEFMIADSEAVVSGGKDFIIFVLKDKLNMKELTPELKSYIGTFTWIKTTNKTNKLMKRIRLFVFYLLLGQTNLIKYITL